MKPYKPQQPLLTSAAMINFHPQQLDLTHDARPAAPLRRPGHRCIRRGVAGSRGGGAGQQGEGDPRRSAAKD